MSPESSPISNRDQIWPLLLKSARGHQPRMKITFQVTKLSLLATIVSAVFLLVTASAFSQSETQFPARTGHVNDFASVLDAATKEHIETLLESFKQRSQIDFCVATVQTTEGKEMFAYSLQLARSWKINSRLGGPKTLLLVISADSKDSFTQISRSVQNDLPEGVLGDLSQRMRTPLSANKFSEALEVGVQYFVNTMGQKMGFTLQDVDKTITASANGQPAPAETPQTPTATEDQSIQTRPRIVKEPITVAETQPAVATDQPQPTPSESPAVKTADSTPAPVVSDAPLKSPRKKISKKTAAETRQPKTSQPAATSSSVSDEDEAEQVELTFTKPLADRPAILNEFLNTHPNSKSRPRAKELLVSTHAALGDQMLKSGDNARGVEELLLAIEQADPPIPDNLFSGVISQIPMNLYLRGEHSAAFKAAEQIETKFGADSSRLLALANFYLRIERGGEATRLATAAVKLSPDSAEAHRVLAVSYHISLKLDEAIAEYKRALEIDPNLKGARASLADLLRGSGKTEEALSLYNEQLKVDPKDKNSISGSVVSLLDLGRDEANSSLESALTSDPTNLQLLTGAAYWYAAHKKYDKALELASKAVAIEPRYTWGQIALAHAQLGLKRPIEAERAIRFAKQFGKFPTLNYELASVLASMGLYDEAVESLRESFSLQNGQIEAKLAGTVISRSDNFVDLLAPERKASIYQATPAGSEATAKTLQQLLSFANAINSNDSEKPDEQNAIATAKEFASGNDNLQAFRQVYSASRLLRKTVGLGTVIELAEDAASKSEEALSSPVATIAVQADEFRDLRARALSAGTVPDVAEAPRNVLSNIFRGRINDIVGWALFNQEKYAEAMVQLQHGADVLPAGTPAWRTDLWHLAIAQEQAGKDSDALANYIRSYGAGEPDPVRRGTIEKLYRKVNGNLNGLDEKLEAAFLASSSSATTTSTATADTNSTKPAETPSSTPEPPVTSAVPDKPVSGETTSPEPRPTPVSDTLKETPAPRSAPQPETTSVPSPVASTAGEPAGMSDSSMKAIAARGRLNVKITGRVVDGNQTGVANVVVVLISPSGSVIAATTDADGKYSFTVAPSEKTYRIIPSKDGYTFAPMDKSLSGLFDDQKNIDFVCSLSRQ